MLRDIKLIIRVLLKQKLYSGITIIGLAVGFSGSLLISAFVWNELSYENVHTKGNNIYRIAVQFGTGSDGMVMAGAMAPLGPAAKSELPEVKDYVRVFRDSDIKVKAGKKEFKAEKFFFADESILNVFSIHLIKKSRHKPLSQISDILISESSALKYFGSSNPVGQVLEYRGELLKVSGVFSDLPENTQIRPDFITSYKLKEQLFPNNAGWYSFGSDITYLLLNKPVTEIELEKKITALIIKNTSSQFAAMIKIIPEHFPGIYLNSRAMGDLIPHGNKNYVYLFSTIAFFVLLVAILNFISLSTSRSFNRAREVGIKKILGAGKNQLVWQYLLESLVISFIAFLISIVIFEIIFPLLINYLEVNSAIGQFKNLSFYLLIFAAFLFTGILSGLYPAFYLTRFNFVQTSKTSGRGINRLWMRKLVVVSQFVISIILIFGTIVIYQQINYMKSYDIGLNKNNVVLINYLPEEDPEGIKFELLKNKLMLHTGIKNVTGVYSLPGITSIDKQTIRLKGQPSEENKVLRFNSVDYSFIELFNVKIIEGRSFNKGYGSDKDESVILNESAAKALGLIHPVGQQVLIPGNNNESRTATVIGLIKDFHIESLQKNLEPMVLYINPSRFSTIAVKVSHESIPQILKVIKKTWNETMPGVEFNSAFMEDNYKMLYSSEEKIYRLFLMFAILALYIASMGLFGLVSFTAEQKRKEIGIRKLLGSGIRGIMLLLTRYYIKLVLTSSVIALPLSLYLMNKWLQEFAYKVTIQWWVFLLAGSSALVITLFTIMFRVIKAANANPVNSLKYE